MDTLTPTAAPLTRDAWARLDLAVRRADAVADTYRHTSVATRCRLLEEIAFRLEGVRAGMLAAATAELGVSAQVVTMEHQAVLEQLRAFSKVLRRNHWHGAAIETMSPVQRMQNIALGPVAVLGAHCAPLYTALAADVIAALAAGCPVVVRAPASHLRCSGLLGQTVNDALRCAGLPEGVYSLVEGGDGSDDALVTHPDIKAVVFNGSRLEGLQLLRRSLDRAEPISVLLEMPSSNPIFVLPAALNARAEHLGQQLLKQFHPCSARGVFKPSLVVAIDGDGYIDLRETIIDGISAMPPVPLPNRSAHDEHADTVDRLLGDKHVDLLAEGVDVRGQRAARAVFAEADAATLLATPMLAEERPGPAGLLVRCANAADMLNVAAQLGRQSVAGLHMAEGDTELATRLMPQLERMARHVSVNSFTALPVFNGATAAEAVRRFLRPVFYLDVPPSLLPAALQDGNPLHLWRQVDGEMRH